MSALSILVSSVLVQPSEAWHAPTHVVIGKIAKPQYSEGIYDLLDTLTRDGKEKSCQSEADQIKRSPEFLSTWADGIKSASGKTSSWHWNDIIGHLTFYKDSNGKTQVAEPLDPNNSSRSFLKALSSYDTEALAGLADQGRASAVLEDLRKVLMNYSMRPDNDFVAESLSEGVKWAYHLFGDVHMPLHSGSMYTNVGLDKNCCQLSDPEICARPEGVLCSNENLFPMSFCRSETNITPVGPSGDGGGNAVFIKMAGNSTAAGSGNLHGLLDAALGAFELTDASVNAAYGCNVDADGNEKKYAWTSTVYDSASDSFVDKTYTDVKFAGIYSTGHEMDAFALSGMSETLDCHTASYIAQYPIAEIQAKGRALLQQTLTKFGVEGVQVPSTFYNPEFTNFDDIQYEQNFFRRHILYKVFADKDFKGADCTEPQYEWTAEEGEAIRANLRVFATLSGYRMASFFNLYLPVTKLTNILLNIEPETCSSGASSVLSGGVAAVVATLAATLLF